MMLKRHLFIIDSDLPEKSKKPNIQPTDWTQCALCQNDKSEALQCPARSTKKPVGVGYISLANDLTKFKEIGKVPMDINIERLDEGNGIESTLRSHEAKWHKSCRLKFNQNEFQRSKQQLFSEGHSSSVVHTRSTESKTSSTDPICFFCDEPANPKKGNLHDAATKNVDENVRRCATLLEDTRLLARLSPGDLIAIEAKYHRICLVGLYNRARECLPNDNDKEDNRLHGIAFAELVAFIEEKHDDECAPVFKLADLTHMYKARLEKLGVCVKERIHSTRLKNRLLSVLPGLKTFMQGKNVFLTFEEDIAGALQKACDYDSDALHLMRAAQIVRDEILKIKLTFEGSFQPDCVRKSIPSSLLALVNMILEGANIEDEGSATHAATTISQLLVFNSVKNSRTSSKVRHTQDRETPVPLYVAMKVHAVSRNKGLIDVLFNLGLCVSYDRLMRVSTEIANGVCQRFSLEDVVCPPSMRGGLFTTAACDNIDHNPSSMTAKDSFHGTGMSLIQHPTKTFGGTDRGVCFMTNTGTRKISHLPQAYTNVPPAALKTKSFSVPSVYGPVVPTNLQATATAQAEEYEWLKKVLEGLGQENLDNDYWVSWAAFHANKQRDEILPPAISALMPLFNENAHSVAMIRHSMNIVRAAVHHLNPGQVPVLCVDQPLYAIAKEIQWTWPDTHGEDHFVILLGGLHIEMAVLKVLGDWLKDSGWTAALTQAEIASSGTADSFIHASHITKTRHAHQVTAACLYNLLNEAYNEYCELNGPAISFEEWSQQRANEFPHFAYWFKTLTLELQMLIYIRSLRERKFDLYVEALTHILPWLFALDHIHYARWLSVHVRDMTVLKEKHPAIWTEFQAGNFVVQKSNRHFSAMAIDQCHEQNNASIKGSGGAVGLTESPGALRRWMIAGPEITRMTSEFENVFSKKSEDSLHHDQQSSVQEAFVKDVRSLTKVIQNMGNPFLEDSQDLLILDTRDVAEPSVKNTVINIETIGKQQYEKFVEERLVQGTKPITDTIPKNKLDLFSSPTTKMPSKQKMQLVALKNDCSLFSRLYISCQAREGDIDEFFKHENQPAPPSLSQGGKIRLGTKADLLTCLLKDDSEMPEDFVIDTLLIDGAAVVQMLNPGTARTFIEYADSVFVPYIFSQLQKAKRLDIIWDVYVIDSLKSTVRDKRGKGKRRRVEPATIIPKHWKDFLSNAENKMELFSFLSQQTIKMTVDAGKEVFATNGTMVLSAPPECDKTNLQPCTQEEADTRLFLHAADAVRKGHKNVVIRTVDTDVVVLAITHFLNIHSDEMWIWFGTGNNFRHINIRQVVSSLPVPISTTLHAFHAYSGCDTTSAFGGRGKKTAWETLCVYPEVTDTFQEMLQMPDNLSNLSWARIERFVILMYDRASEFINIDEARKSLFAQRGRTLENLPPTHAALVQHTKRAIYQAHVWNQALVADPQIPSPSGWGWVKEGDRWHPHWSDLSEASKSCYELLKCGCKKGCNKRCKCKNARLNCTALCSCAGDCPDECQE